MYTYIQNESIGDQDGPSKPSDNVDISIKVVGDVHKERAYDVGSECSFTRQLPRLSGASSSSSQSLVNEDELEAAEKQLEAMREQVEMDSLRRQLQKLTERHEAGRLKFAQFEKLVHKVTEVSFLFLFFLYLLFFLFQILFSVSFSMFFL